MTTQVTVTERPILFSDEMVLAIMAGRKTQTRRVAKPPTKARFLPDDHWKNDVDEPGTAYLDDESGRLRITCPYGVPGDRLWVRETWNIMTWVENTWNGGHDLDDWSGPIPKVRPKSPYCLGYRADCDDVDAKWRSPIFMPRWASRITLEITEVRVDQLQDICQEDAYAEGIEEWGLPEQTFSPVVRFHELWDRINGGKHPWAGNPWVWVVAFKRVTCEANDVASFPSNAT